MALVGLLKVMVLELVELLITIEPEVVLDLPIVRAPAERFKFALVRVRALLDPILQVEAALPVRLRAWLAALLTLADDAPLNVSVWLVKVLPLYVPEVVMLPVPKVKEPLDVDKLPPPVVMLLPLVVKPPGIETM